MTQPLPKLGVPTVAVALPSCGETGGALGDLYDDVYACRQAIAAADGPVVLCGHSYGGMIITDAGADERVTQLLYVTSVMPDAGQSQADLIGAEPAPWLRPGEDGTVGVDPDMIRRFFLQDCDETTTEQAVSRLTRQSLTPFTQPPRHIAWKQKPATYFVCTEDLANRPRRSVNAPERIPDSSSSAQGITHFSRVPTRSQKASSPGSTAVEHPHRLLIGRSWRRSRRGSRSPESVRVALLSLDYSCPIGDCDELYSVASAELHEDSRDVCLGGERAELKLICDLGVG